VLALFKVLPVDTCVTPDGNTIVYAARRDVDVRRRPEERATGRSLREDTSDNSAET
jgi:hypothetical protein